MSKKVHLKIAGIDCRDQGQTDHEYMNQALCGHAGVAVTRIKKDISCKLCLRRIEDDSNIDDLSNYGGGHD